MKSDKPSAKRYLAEKRWLTNRAKRVARFEKMVSESRRRRAAHRAGKLAVGAHTNSPLNLVVRGGSEDAP